MRNSGTFWLAMIVGIASGHTMGAALAIGHLANAVTILCLLTALALVALYDSYRRFLLEFED